MTIKTLVALAKIASYNEDNKKKFKRAAKKWLADIAERMEFPAESFDIRYNEGGIAVSGEGTLHHDKVYVQVSDGGCYVRTVKSRKDFVGGPNVWVEGYGHSMSNQEIVDQLLRMGA